MSHKHEYIPVCSKTGARIIGRVREAHVLDRFSRLSFDDKIENIPSFSEETKIAKLITVAKFISSNFKYSETNLDINTRVKKDLYQVCNFSKHDSIIYMTELGNRIFSFNDIKFIPIEEYNLLESVSKINKEKS